MIKLKPEQFNMYKRVNKELMHKKKPINHVAESGYSFAEL